MRSELGVGTTFTMQWPGLADTPSTTAETSPLTVPTGGETILLVEDDDAVRKLIRLALTMQGYQVLEARQGSDAIPLVRAHGGSLSLLITDVVMPRLGGRELADAVRALCPDLRVLFISGYTSDAVIQRESELANVGFLQKPFTPLELARKVRSLLDGVTD